MIMFWFPKICPVFEVQQIGNCFIPFGKRARSKIFWEPAIKLLCVIAI